MNSFIILYSLSDYNNGNLVDKEFDLNTVSYEDYLTEISDWLESLDEELGTDIYIPAREETIVADAEGVPDRFLSEYSLSREFFEYRDIAEEIGSDIVEAWISYGNELDEDKINEAYMGSYQSDEEFVQELLEESGVIPELPVYIYIDWERVARDMMMDYFESGGHYFSAHV